MTEIVVADIGGTHARLALAEIADGKVLSLGSECTLRTVEHASLHIAWDAFARELGRSLPPVACIAIAGPVRGEILQLTNNPWVLRLADLPSQLGLDRLKLINDFGAVAHAVAQLGPAHFSHLCGPPDPLPASGVPRSLAREPV